MDVSKCKILFEAVNCGSLSAAALKLGYTTAGVSYNVDAIEDESGFPLIKRGHAGVSLTPAGEKIVPVLHEMVQVEAKLARVSAEVKKTYDEEVTIGTFPSIATRLMPEILRAFQKKHPQAKIKFYEGVQQELEKRLSNNEVDFCLCSYREKYNKEWIPLRRDPLRCVIPEEHPLASKESISPKDLNDQPFILQAYGRDADVVDLLGRFGVKPQIKFTTIETDTAFAMVEHGFGIVVTNELTIHERLSKAVVRPFDPPQFITEGIYLNSMENVSPMVRRMIEFLKDYFEEKEGKL